MEDTIFTFHSDIAVFQEEYMLKIINKQHSQSISVYKILCATKQSAFRFSRMQNNEWYYKFPNSFSNILSMFNKK